MIPCCLAPGSRRLTPGCGSKPVAEPGSLVTRLEQMVHLQHWPERQSGEIHASGPRILLHPHSRADFSACATCSASCLRPRSHGGEMEPSATPGSWGYCGVWSSHHSPSLRGQREREGKGLCGEPQPQLPNPDLLPPLSETEHRAQLVVLRVCRALKRM